MNLERALSVMEEAATKAAEALATMQPTTKRLESRKDFLTDADLTAEKHILNVLTAKYPDIPSLSEEKGGEEITEGYLWVIDPIDGTINFFLQDDHWGISIALVENGKTVAGVIYLPARKQMFSASKETPARLRVANTSADLHVSDADTLSGSQFWFGWGKEENNGKDHDNVYEALKRIDRHTLYPQIRNSATADLMALASGKIAGYVFLKPEPFDIAAAGLIVERAGATVTDLQGNPWGPFSRSLIASTPALHSEVLKLLNK